MSNKVIIVDDLYPEEKVLEIEQTYLRYWPWYYVQASTEDQAESVNFFMSDKRSKWTNNYREELRQD